MFDALCPVLILYRQLSTHTGSQAPLLSGQTVDIPLVTEAERRDLDLDLPLTPTPGTLMEVTLLLFEAGVGDTEAGAARSVSKASLGAT